MVSQAQIGSARIRIWESISDILRNSWNTCVDEGNPFLEHEFLQALEESDSVGPGTGWEPGYLTLESDSAGLLAAAPFYVREDSWGEFIFDFQWASGFEQAGIPYYPKITVAAPFTPATGSRFLFRPDVPAEPAIKALASSLIDLADSSGCSSVHVLFCTPHECDLLKDLGFLPRLTYQFHWTNYGYKSFDDYLNDLRSQKRKHIRKERREAATLGLDLQTVTGNSITNGHMDALWRFYQKTYLRKGGSPGYLKKAFFPKILESFRHRMVLSLAEKNGEPVAGTLNFEKGPNLYGRYWGTDIDAPNLHFELCFYQLIDHAISTGKVLFEAGAQGEHKFLRGFAARPTWSCHWVRNPAGRRAIANFLERERAAVERTISSYNRASPLKRIRGTQAAGGLEAGDISPWRKAPGYAGEGEER